MRIVIALTCCTFQIGCVSMSALQTAETLKKGEAQVTYGGGIYKSDSFLKDTDAKDLSFPYFEASYREGIADRWDIGGKITVIGSAVLDGKYEFYRGEKFHAATAFGVGYFETSSESAGKRQSSRAIDGMIPLYVSYSLAKEFSIYASPRYILRSVSNPSSSSTMSIGGATAGIKIGKIWGTYLEAGYQKDLGGDFSAMQYNVALFFNESGLFSSVLGL